MSHKPNILFGKVDPNELTTPSLYHQSQSTKFKLFLIRTSNDERIFRNSFPSLTPTSSFAYYKLSRVEILSNSSLSEPYKSKKNDDNYITIPPQNIRV
jgi:hypothetical protein